MSFLIFIGVVCIDFVIFSGLLGCIWGWWFWNFFFLMFGGVGCVIGFGLRKGSCWKCVRMFFWCSCIYSWNLLFWLLIGLVVICWFRMLRFFGCLEYFVLGWIVNFFVCWLFVVGSKLCLLFVFECLFYLFELGIFVVLVLGVVWCSYREVGRL